jgi:hypothetical protein
VLNILIFPIKDQSWIVNLIHFAPNTSHILKNVRNSMNYHMVSWNSGDVMEHHYQQPRNGVPREMEHRSTENHDNNRYTVDCILIVVVIFSGRYSILRLLDYTRIKLHVCLLKSSLHIFSHFFAKFWYLIFYIYI